MLKKCFFCNKLTITAYHVTEKTPDGTWESFDMCKRCGAEFVKDAYGETTSPVVEEKKGSDLTQIKTVGDLMAFFAGAVVPAPKPTATQTCECGMTTELFQKTGRFGCPKCYDVFEETMNGLVYPWHGADEHVGKVPCHQIRRRCEANDEEKMKLLKLQYAQAIELEKYERAAEIHKEIKSLESKRQVSSDL